MTDRMAVYRPYDSAGTLLYVGVTKNFGQRWQQQAAQKPWWRQMDYMTVKWYDDDAAAAVAAEQAALDNERPVHNVMRTNKNYRPSRVTPGASLQKYMGSAEIGRMLSVGRARVQQIINGDGFPEPYDVLAMGKVWKRADVVAWARKNGRPVAGDETEKP